MLLLEFMKGRIHLQSLHLNKLLVILSGLPLSKKLTKIKSKYHFTEKIMESPS